MQAPNLAFNDIGVTSSSDDEPQVYAVKITAFDENGKLISNTHGFSPREFLASGFRFVSDKARADLGQSLSMQNMESYYANKKRIQAAEVLIDEEMFDSAERLIAKISEQASKGKKDALTGYLHAKKGLCKEAERYFEKALSAGGKQCLPSSYRVECRNGVGEK